MTRRRIVLQARTGSARLPGKVLLPIAGLPLVVLAARRAARGGLELVVATSTDASDDRLAQTLQAHGLRCVRGPLEDVLARFLLATADLDAADLCVRLTADNVFPDEDFVHQLAATAERSAGGYAGFTGGSGGWPYGMAGEAMRVGLLREADRMAKDAADREHVTPWIRRKAGEAAPPLERPAAEDFSQLRCTIDTLDDFRRVRAAFVGVADAVAVPALELCRRLAQRAQAMQELIPARIVAGDLHSNLVVGGAQLGSAYGIANTAGQPEKEELDRILELAAAAGVTHLDTAAAYGEGESENRVGASTPADAFAIVTKLPPTLNEGNPGAKELERRVYDGVERTLSRLRRTRIDVLLLHRFEHFGAADGAAWHALVALKRKGIVGRIGCSIDAPADLTPLLANPEVGLIQLPFNILDRRWLAPALQERIALRADVLLHGRSPFLQGALTFADPMRWPTKDKAHAQRCIDSLRKCAAQLGRASVVELCLAYALSQRWLSGVVVGSETAGQMRDNVRIARSAPLSDAELRSVDAAVPADSPESLLNPALWPAPAH